MKVELLYSDGCPNIETLLLHLRLLLEHDGILTNIDLRRITDDDAAQRERFLGSPTVRVDGRDVEPGAELRTDYGMKFRLYRTRTGLVSQPPAEWLRSAFARRRRFG